MSSSGLIYAFIVGAWAVYLVPMWLRREDELNKARQTHRYTTAIKVLSHKDSFERRYGATAASAGAQSEEQARELPVAVGQSGSAPAAGARTLDRVKAKDRERVAKVAPSGSAGAGAARPAASPAAAAKSAASAARPKVALAAESGASPARRATVSAKVEAANAGVWTPAPATSAPSSPALGPRSGLRARRRRVVSFLFALTSLGAIVSADLGMSYVWVMLLPAAGLTAFIVWVRKDERARTAERARRRAAAAKAMREAERRALESQRQQEEAEHLEREELARRSAVVRRRTAAARSRAERRTAPGVPDQGDLPRAANG